LNPLALEAAAAVATEACEWGFDLIKHDFTNFELLGQWGSQMGASPTQGNWHFNDRTLTNAEIVTAMYRRLRASCGEERRSAKSRKARCAKPLKAAFTGPAVNLWIG